MVEAPNLITILRQQSKLGTINVPRAAMRDAADHIEILERQIVEVRAELINRVNHWSELYSKEYHRAEAAEAENARLRALPLKDERHLTIDEQKTFNDALRKSGTIRQVLPLKDEVERVLPAIPDDDSDFTPDLARKKP